MMAEVYAQASLHNTEIVVTLQWYAHRILQLAPKGALLELGIGFGESTRMFADHFSRHVVVDSSAEVIAHFNDSFGATKAQIITQRFEDFSTDERFNAIVMGFVLEHVDDPELILRRFAQFLKPEGHLFVTVPNARSLHRLIGKAAGLLSDLHELSDYDRQAGHQRYFDHESAEALIKKCGYTIIRSEGVLLKPVTSRQMQQLGFEESIFMALCEIGIDLPGISNSILFHAVKSENEF